MLSKSVPLASALSNKAAEMPLITLIALDGTTNLANLLREGVGERAVFEALAVNADVAPVAQRAEYEANPLIIDASAGTPSQKRELAVASDLILLALEDTSTGLSAVSLTSSLLDVSPEKIKLILGASDDGERGAFRRSADALFDISTLFEVPPASATSLLAPPSKPNDHAAPSATLSAPCNAAARRHAERVAAKAGVHTNIDPSIKVRFAATAARSQAARDAAAKKSGQASTEANKQPPEAEQAAPPADTPSPPTSNLAVFLADLVLSQIPA